MQRRQLVIGIPAIWLSASVPAKSERSSAKVDELVAELAAALEAMHGGNWSCRYDHKLLMIQRV